VARGGQDLQGHAALRVTQRNALAVVQPADRELDRRELAHADLGTRALGQLRVARDEVGMHVGQEHQIDREALLLGLVEVLLDVAARVDDDRAPGGRISDQVRGLGQAGQVVLLDDHSALPSSCRWPHIGATALRSRQVVVRTIHSP
jgi:hypothetical protein